MKASEAFEQFFNRITAKYPDMVPTNTHKDLLCMAWLDGQRFELEKQTMERLHREADERTN